MTHARDISPRLLTDDVLAETGPFGSWLYVGLSMLADRDGRLEDRPRQIKAAVFPYWTVPTQGADLNADVSEMYGAPAQSVEYLLSMLAARGLIDRYEADGVKVIQLTRWNSEQHPHPAEKASALPARCPESVTSESTLDPSWTQVGLPAVPSVPSDVRIASFTLSDTPSPRAYQQDQESGGSPAVNGSGHKADGPPLDKKTGRQTDNGAATARKPPGRTDTPPGRTPGDAARGRKGGLEPLADFLPSGWVKKENDAPEVPSSPEKPPKKKAVMWPHSPAMVAEVRGMLSRYKPRWLPNPDDGMACKLLDIARAADGRSVEDMERVIWGCAKRRKLDQMYSWGFLPVIVGGRFGVAVA